MRASIEYFRIFHITHLCLLPKSCKKTDRVRLLWETQYAEWAYYLCEPRLEVFFFRYRVWIHTPPLAPQKKIWDFFRGGGVCTQATEGGRRD